MNGDIKTESVNQNGSDNSAGEGCAKLFIGNLAYGCSPTELKAAFELETTEVIFVDVLKGYGFVQLKSATEAKRLKALMHGRVVKTRAINVELANKTKGNRKNRTKVAKKSDDLTAKGEGKKEGEGKGWVKKNRPINGKKTQNNNNPRSKKQINGIDKNGFHSNGKKKNTTKNTSKPKKQKFVPASRFWPKPPQWGIPRSVEPDVEEQRQAKKNSVNQDQVQATKKQEKQEPDQEKRQEKPQEKKIPVKAKQQKQEQPKNPRKKVNAKKPAKKTAIRRKKKRAPPPVRFINDMQDSMLLRLFGYLTEASSLVRCSLVCKRWLRLSSDGSLWKAHCENFPNYVEPKEKNDKTNWKQQFVSSYQSSAMREIRTGLTGLRCNQFCAPQLAPSNFRALPLPISTIYYSNYEKYAVATVGRGVAGEALLTCFPHPVAEWPLELPITAFFTSGLCPSCNKTGLSLIYFKCTADSPVKSSNVTFQAEFECLSCNAFLVFNNT